MIQHVTHPQNRSLLNSILLALFDLAVNVETVYWSVNKPLLPIILISQEEFGQIQQIMIKRSPSPPSFSYFFLYFIIFFYILISYSHG